MFVSQTLAQILHLCTWWFHPLPFVLLLFFLVIIHYTVVSLQIVQFKIQWNGYDALLLMDIKRGLVIVDPLTKVS